jgi:hypothetical protein
LLRQKRHTDAHATCAEFLTARLPHMLLLLLLLLLLSLQAPGLLGA